MVCLDVHDAATSGQRAVGGLLLLTVVLVALPFVFFFCHVALRNARRWHRIDPPQAKEAPRRKIRSRLNLKVTNSMP